MADKTVFICSFLLLALCIIAAAAIAFYSPNPPTAMQSRLLDSLLMVVTGGTAAIFTLIRSSRAKR
jgi:hypothetical protein